MNCINNYRKKVLFMTIFLLSIGTLFYLLFCPETYFTQFCNRLFGNVSIFVPEKIFSSMLFLYLRYYLLDCIWAYCLICILALFIEDNNGFKEVIIIGIVFIIIIELSQLFSIVPGTFDFWDIVVEIISALLAVLNLYIIRRYWG